MLWQNISAMRKTINILGVRLSSRSRRELALTASESRPEKQGGLRLVTSATTKIRGVFRLALSLTTACFLLAVTGCSKSDSELKTSDSRLQTPDSRQTVARLHWLGKKRLAAESNATNFMDLWNLPESAKLEAQTLEKLSTAPWRLLSAATPLSNAPTSVLRLLLEDMVREESYLEVQAATNQPGALVLAIRLDAVRAALWRTNLPIVLQSIFGSSTEPIVQAPTADFSLQTSDFKFDLSRSGHWTLLSLSQVSPASATPRPSTLDPQPSPLSDFAARIQRDHAPFSVQATNYWLTTEADLRLLATLFRPSTSSLQPSMIENLPRLNLTLIGDGQNVRTRGELDFPAPLAIPLAPWILPTNLVREPLISFGAVRGLRGLLAALQVPSWLGLSAWPDQFYSWGRSGPPLQIFAAFPTRNASNDFHQLSHPVAEWINAHLPATNYGSLAFATNAPLLTWDGLYYGLPSLRVVTNASSDFLMLALAPVQWARTNELPATLNERIANETNLLALAWEFTGERLSLWRYFDDASRMTFDATHRPRLNRYMASIEWVANVRTNLEHSITEVRLADPARLTFARKATVGLTGWEINVLANWLELPQFPAGFQTLFATNSTPPINRRKASPNPPSNSAP